jgi:AcrR family transcriptional regulator
VTTIDRAEAVRSALRTLVAERGFHGASMSAVAEAAGVATGTAYTHYASKDELVLAAYRETKAQLGAAATVGPAAAAPPADDGARSAGATLGDGAADRFRAIFLGSYRHLAARPDHARFLLQVDHSPYRAAAHAALPDDDPIVAAAATFAAELLPLPLEVLYELGLAPAVRLAAAEVELSDAELDAVADACWRAISRPR